jgi:hypothetical protein
MRERLLLVAMAVLATACGDGDRTPTTPTAGPSTSNTATATALAITGPEVVPIAFVGRYKATATMSNGGTIYNASAEWSTSDALVATIDGDGSLKANRQGTVAITAAYRGATTTTAVRVTADTAARVHLEEILGLMEAHSINRLTINWESFRRQVLAAAAGGPTIADAYPAITLALELLNDRDSFYLSSDKQQRIESPGSVCGPATTPAGAPAVPAAIGYVRVPAFSSNVEREIAEFAESIQRAIRTADRPGLIGWIVDLRGNVGGNMWPMLAGVGPIIDEGIVGYIVYPDRKYEREYRGGAAQSFGEVFARVAAPYTLLRPNPRVAVLSDGAVISAGEAIAVFFRGRPGTRSFGVPTCGHHHLFTFYPLTDGAYMALVEAEPADRTNVTYRGPIVPDEMIADPTEAIERAIAWLQAGS